MSGDCPLLRPVTLKSGEKGFQKLRDAAVFLQERYSNARSGPLQHAIIDLMAAAEKPTKANVARATDQLVTFLAQENLVDAEKPRAARSDLEQRIRDKLIGRRSAAAKAVRKVGVLRSSKYK